MRFRHKLSIVLIGLALVPLVAAGFLVLRLLEHDKIANVDSGLVTSVTAGGQAYGAQVAQAETTAATIAGRRAVQVAARSVDPTLTNDTLQGFLPTTSQGMRVIIERDGMAKVGRPPAGPYLRGEVAIKKCDGCRVVVAVPFSADLLTKLTEQRFERAAPEHRHRRERTSGRIDRSASRAGSGNRRRRDQQRDDLGASRCGR